MVNWCGKVNNIHLLQHVQTDQRNKKNLAPPLMSGNKGEFTRKIPHKSSAFTLGIVQQGELRDPQQTLILLHGFTGSAANWSDLLPCLAAPGRRLIALDLLGHGRSEAPDDPLCYTIVHSQDDILATLRALGVHSREAILLGYSLGGRIGLYAAFSGFFRALILESASPGLVTEAEREQRRQSDYSLAERIEREGVEAFIDYWEKLPLFSSQHSLPLETRAALRKQRLNNRANGLANSLRGAGTGVQPTLHARLPALDLPVLLLAGELDTKFCQIAEQMARSLPQANLRIVPGAGHTVHLEQPTLFSAFVNEFCHALC